MPFFRDLITQLNELLAQQTLTKKIMAAAALLAVVGLLLAQVFQLGRTIDYAVLYSELTDTNARKVREELDRLGAKYELSRTDAGWTVLVPVKEKENLRLDTVGVIEAAGDRPGWELFDRTSIGVTPFTQKINRKRAIEGELARTIMHLSAVKSASVRVVIPEESVFIKPQARPTAAVLVEMAGSATLSPEQVGTVQALVAGSVEGLVREDVVVADTRGNELTKRKEAGTMEEVLDQRERLVAQHKKQREEYEDYLEGKILSSLSQIFGANHVAANVNVDFDFTEKEETALTYDPEHVVLAEAQRFDGAGATPRFIEGVIGATRQMGETKGDVVTTTGADQEWQAERILNYNVGKTEAKTVHAPYLINRITAAIFVDDLPARPELDADGKPVADKDGNVATSRKAPDKQQLKALEDSVRRIVGFSEDRPGGVSDEVTVVHMPFTPPIGITADETIERIQRQELTVMLVKWGVLALLALMILIFIARPLVRIVAPRPAPPALEGPARRAALGPAPAERALLEAAPPPAELPAARREREEVPPPPPPTGETPDLLRARQEELDGEILELSRANPKKVPLILRSWMES